MPQPRVAHGGDKKFESPKNVRSTISRLFRYMLHYRGQLAIVFICIIISALAGVAGTYFIKPIINDYVVPLIGSQHPDMTGFLHLIMVLAGIYVLGIVCTYIYQRLMINISTGVLRQVRIEMYDHMMLLPLRYHDSTSTGQLMSRYSNDTDTLREMISQSVPQIINAVLTITGIFVMMLILSPLLTLLVLLMLAAMVFAAKKIGTRSGSYFIKQQRELGALNGYIEEMTAGVKVVKVFCHEKQAEKEFGEKNEQLFNAAKNAHTYANILMPVMGNLSYLNYALVAACGALLAIAGKLDLGSIGSFLQYTRSFSQPVANVSQQFNSILSALAGAERIFDLIDQPLEEDKGRVTLANVREDGQCGFIETEEHTDIWAWKQYSAGCCEYTRLRGEVRFNDVSFSYVPEKEVLHHVSFYAKPGQKIALVGSTGAGKTTITNLLNRFYDIEQGSITYDGIDIRDINKRELRRSLAMVLQDTHLFTGTVRENIRYGRLSATDEEVEAAARLANADYFISHLPQGYDTVIGGDGANLSAGQRQLVAIARAAVADPPVLVLDEATSSIDTRTEALIEQGMDKLMEGRTVFVIAHRLSTVRNANAIMVMENGRIIERGDHDELLAQKGRYYQLYTGSFEME